VLRLLEENVGVERGDDEIYPRHVILPMETDIRVGDRVVAVPAAAKDPATGRVLGMSGATLRILFDGEQDAEDGVVVSKVHLAAVTASQVDQIAGPNCRRLRFVSPTVDEAYVQFHPSEGLQVCFVVHDCLWRPVLAADDHRVYLVRDEGKDQRLGAFIAHTLRSPMRWYFKCLVLEALCGQVVGGRVPVRLVPTPNDLVTMHALVDRFEHTVTKVGVGSRCCAALCVGCCMS
jgi:hypothetical protein